MNYNRYLQGIEDAKVVAYDIEVSIGSKYIVSCLQSYYSDMCRYYSNITEDNLDYINGFKHCLERLIVDSNKEKT